jgi:hypothetical protein
MSTPSNSTTISAAGSPQSANSPGARDYQGGGRSDKIYTLSGDLMYEMAVRVVEALRRISFFPSPLK